MLLKRYRLTIDVWVTFTKTYITDHNNRLRYSSSVIEMVNAFPAPSLGLYAFIICR